MIRLVDLLSIPARKVGEPPPSQATPEQSSKVIRLDSNENPFGPSRFAVEAMRDCVNGVQFYPDDESGPLRRRLADLHKLPLEQVIVTAGSTQMIALLCRTMLQPGLNAVTSERSFIVYGMAVRATGADLIEAPTAGDGLDLGAILDAINEHTRLVFISNPNNPTGTMLDAAALTQFISEVSGHVVVALDEAYYEFAADFAQRRNAEYSRSLDYLHRCGNVVVLRTFSKVHGLAGLRVGYGLGSAELLAYCARMRSTYSVSSVAQAAALAAIDDHEHIARTLSNNAVQAEALGAALSELGYRVVPTWANFLYCDVGGDGAAFAKRLLADGISVRPLGAWGAPNRVRISIGTPEQNAAVLNSVRKISNKSAGMK